MSKLQSVHHRRQQPPANSVHLQLSTIVMTFAKAYKTLGSAMTTTSASTCPHPRSTIPPPATCTGTSVPHPRRIHTHKKNHHHHPTRDDSTQSEPRRTHRCKPQRPNPKGLKALRRVRSRESKSSYPNSNRVATASAAMAVLKSEWVAIRNAPPALHCDAMRCELGWEARLP